MDLGRSDKLGCAVVNRRVGFGEGGEYLGIPRCRTCLKPVGVCDVYFFIFLRVAERFASTSLSRGNELFFHRSRTPTFYIDVNSRLMFPENGNRVILILLTTVMMII